MEVMAKNRQIETDLFSQGWFYELSNDAKILYIYCYLNADNAGIIELINRRIQFDLQIDIEKSFVEIKNEFTVIGNNRFLIKRILFTQFPNGLCSPEHPFQKSVIKLLENEGIDIETYELLQALPEAYLSLTQALPKAHSNSNSISNSISISNSNSNSEKEKNSNLPTKSQKKQFLDCVKLTEDEHQKLIEHFLSEETANEKIQVLNDYIMSKGKKYSSHYHTILNWDRMDKSKKATSTQFNPLRTRLKPDGSPFRIMTPEEGENTYDRITMAPKADFIITDTGKYIGLDWEILTKFPSAGNCEFPTVKGSTKVKRLPEDEKQAYCRFFSLEMTDLELKGI
jgi:hypothetical protein